MRLLTHNTMRNNSKDANGKGFPLRITAVEVKVMDNKSSQDGQQHKIPTGNREIAFVKHMLPTLEWTALVQAASQVGISTLPTTLTEDMANDPQFLQALYHVLMNVHVIRGMLTCPVSGREFPIKDGIPDMILEEEECERVRL